MSEKKLSKLHEMLCDELLKRLKGGEDQEPLSASELNVIRQFLKDNNIDGLPAEGSALGEVVKSLPERFFQ
jgi:hypothetical protein